MFAWVSKRVKRLGDFRCVLMRKGTKLRLDFEAVKGVELVENTLLEHVGPWKSFISGERTGSES